MTLRMLSEKLALVVEVEHLVKCYSSIRAVDDISFQVIPVLSNGLIRLVDGALEMG